MPQINGLPTTEPVGRPQANPGEFAIPGNTAADMGQETANMAQANVAFEGHLAEAQRYLKYKQIEINVGQLENKAYDSLSKSVTTEDAQQVHATFQQDVSNALGPYMGDKSLARQLHLYSQKVDVEMQHNVNARKATIVQHNDIASNKVLYKNSVQEAVNVAAADGDPTVVGDKLEAKLRSSAAMGTMYPEQVDEMMQQYHKEVDKGTIQAKYNSPDPAIRNGIIEKLRSGQGFPYLDEADINASLSAAEKRDHELSHLAMWQNLDVATEKFNQLSAGMTFEGKMGMLDSDSWAKANGYVDNDGYVDRQTINELRAEVNRQEADRFKIQGDKDTDIISKHQSDADNGKLSVPQIDKIVHDEGGSPKAANILKRDLHQHITEQRVEAHFGEFVRGSAVRDDRRNARVTGDKIQADVFRQISTGSTVDMSTVWDKVDDGDMTTTQALKVQAHITARQNADYAYDSTRIANASGVSDKAKADMTLDLLDAKNKQGLQGNEMHAFTDKLLQDHGKKVIDDSANQFFHNLFRPPLSKGEGKKADVTTPIPRPQGAVETSTINGVEYYFDANHKNLGRVK